MLTFQLSRFGYVALRRCDDQCMSAYALFNCKPTSLVENNSNNTRLLEIPKQLEYILSGTWWCYLLTSPWLLHLFFIESIILSTGEKMGTQIINWTNWRIQSYWHCAHVRTGWNSFALGRNWEKFNELMDSMNTSNIWIITNLYRAYIRPKI